MRWPEIRQAYPEQWLVIEALEAHTPEEQQRILDRLAVLDTCEDRQNGMERYRELDKRYPLREFYFAHTRRENLEIYDRQWLGIRCRHEPVTSR